MNDERLMILKMLEEGKISSKEAIDLIDALEDGKNKSKTDPNININSKKITETLESFGNTFTSAMLNIVDGVKNIDLSNFISQNYETDTRNLTEDISQIENPILDISSTNGYVSIDTVEGSNLMAKLEFQYNPEKVANVDTLYNFEIEDNIIKLNPNPDYKSPLRINMNILLPRKQYESLKIKTQNSYISLKKIDAEGVKLLTQNGKIDLEDVISKEITVNSSNGAISAERIGSSKLDIITTNGKVKVNDFNGEFLYSKTTNAPVEIDNVRGNNLMVKTSNSKIIVEDSDLNLMDLETKNSNINIYLNKETRRNYFDLSTSYGAITLNKNGLLYDINDIENANYKKVVAKDKDYEESLNKTNIKAYTTHGSIAIN